MKIFQRTFFLPNTYVLKTCLVYRIVKKIVFLQFAKQFTKCIPQTKICFFTETKNVKEF